jgi:hypothetical protein
LYFYCFPPESPVWREKRGRSRGQETDPRVYPPLFTGRDTGFWEKPYMGKVLRKPQNIVSEI